MIDNIHELAEFVNNTRYAKKFLKINSESPVFKLEKSDMIKFIRDHPKLSRQIRFNETKEKVIGVLNDDILKSNLTNVDYESESKSTMRDEVE